MTRRCLAIALFACLPAMPAAAIAVHGAFTGVAHVSPQAMGRSTVGDVPVTGSFVLEIPTAPWGDGSGVAPPSARIAFDLGGQRFSFLAGPDQVDAPGVVSIADDPLQSVSFLTSHQPRFDGAILTFGSLDHRLFDPSDFSTLAIDGRTVSWMSASFASSRAALAASIDVMSFQFGAVAPPVDEPAPWTLMMAGVAALAAWRTRSTAPAAVGESARAV